MCNNYTHIVYTHNYVAINADFHVNSVNYVNPG